MVEVTTAGCNANQAGRTRGIKTGTSEDAFREITKYYEPGNDGKLTISKHTGPTMRCPSNAPSVLRDNAEAALKHLNSPEAAKLPNREQWIQGLQASVRENTDTDRRHAATDQLQMPQPKVSLSSDMQQYQMDMKALPLDRQITTLGEMSDRDREKSGVLRAAIIDKLVDNGRVTPEGIGTSAPAVAQNIERMTNVEAARHLQQIGDGGMRYRSLGGGSGSEPDSDRVTSSASSSPSFFDKVSSTLSNIGHSIAEGIKGIGEGISNFFGSLFGSSRREPEAPRPDIPPMPEFREPQIRRHQDQQPASGGSHSTYPDGPAPRPDHSGIPLGVLPPEDSHVIVAPNARVGNMQVSGGAHVNIGSQIPGVNSNVQVDNISVSGDGATTNIGTIR